MQLLQHLSNYFLNSLNCLLIYLLTYSDYMTSLIRQFPETKVHGVTTCNIQQCDRSDAQRKLQMELLVSSQQLLKRFPNEM